MDKLDLILQKLDEHDKRFNALDTALKQQGDMLTQLIGIVAATNQKTSEMQSKVNLIDERTQRLDASQAQQEKAVSSLAVRSIEHESAIRDLRSAR